MKEKFHITGFYYNIDELRFRKYLNIKHKKTKLDNPDLMVVMMNPGSSKPLEQENCYNKEVIAKPDNTQAQIMKLMCSLNFEYARILNLSDLREPKSQLFYNQIDLMNKLKIPHSIFQEERKSDFEKFFIRNRTTILGWGVNNKLRFLANDALDSIGNEKIYGLLKPNTKNKYYHPLPPNARKQEKWLQDILKQFK